MFVSSLELKFLKPNCVLNDQSYPSTFFSFFRPTFLDYAVARCFLRVEFSLRLVSWMAANWILFLCIRSMMLSSFCLRPLKLSCRILRFVLSCLVFASIVLLLLSIGRAYNWMCCSVALWAVSWCNSGVTILRGVNRRRPDSS